MVPTFQWRASWITAVPTAELAPFWITHDLAPAGFLAEVEGGSDAEDEEDDSGSSGMKSDSMRSAVGGLMERVAAWVGVSAVDDGRRMSWR